MKESISSWELRVAALKNGDVSFETTPCKKCGDRKRYVCSGACVNCCKGRMAKRYEERKSKKVKNG